MSTITLSAVKAGITRLRTKGGASPESLYDLVNGFVTAQRTIQIRPGAPIDDTLPSGAVGLCAFQGNLVFFATEPLVAPSALYRCAVLAHPTDPDANLVEIPFAEPYAGALYVVAEFTDGAVFHYWLEETRTWAASTVYLDGQLVQPSVTNGLAYKAVRLDSVNPAWAAHVARVVGDKVEPTVYTGYYYEVAAVTGAAPISGAIEPTWPTAEGQTVLELADAGIVTGTVPDAPGYPGPGGTDDDPYTGNPRDYTP